MMRMLQLCTDLPSTEPKMSTVARVMSDAKDDRIALTKRRLMRERAHKHYSRTLRVMCEMTRRMVQHGGPPTMLYCHLVCLLAKAFRPHVSIRSSEALNMAFQEFKCSTPSELSAFLSTKCMQDILFVNGPATANARNRLMHSGFAAQVQVLYDALQTEHARATVKATAQRKPQTAKKNRRQVRSLGEFEELDDFKPTDSVAIAVALSGYDRNGNIDSDSDSGESRTARSTARPKNKKVTKKVQS